MITENKREEWLSYDLKDFARRLSDKTCWAIGLQLTTWLQRL